MVVAHLVEQSLPTPEVHSSNPVFGKFLCRTFVYCRLHYIEKTKKEKEAGNSTLKNQNKQEVSFTVILPLKLMFSDYVIKSVVSFYCDIIERKLSVGSGCGSLGRAVAANTRGPRFESSHRQFLKKIKINRSVVQ